MNEDKFYEEIGQLICEERLKAGVKQEDLANFLELSRASIVNIEKGRQRASTFLIMNVAKYLNIDFTKLIPAANSKPDLSEPVVSFNAAEFPSEWDLNNNSKKSLENFLDLIKK